MELVIVLAVLIAIVAMSIGPSVRIIRWMKETDNKDKILNLSKGIEAVYKTTRGLWMRLIQTHLFLK